MGVANWRIWQIGIFKTVAFMFSSPTTVMDVFIVREEGTLGLEKMPLKTGYVKQNRLKIAWHAMHDHTVTMDKRELPVLPVSERSRIPLDPYGLHTSSDNVEAINDIAANSYNEAFSRLKDRTAEGENVKMARSVFYGVVILAIVVFLLSMVRC